MSEEDKKKKQNCVTDKLCEARQEVLEQKINGLKNTMYAVGATTTLIIVATEFILTMIG